MKKNRLLVLIALAGLMIAFASWGQEEENPVTFNYEVKKIGEKVYEIRIIAKIDDPWHIYSQYTPAEGPSLPTSISFSKNPLVELVGKPQEKGTLIVRHEKILDVDLKYFAGQVEFVQTVKLKANVKTNIVGTINYMACTEQRCLLPTSEKFTLGIQ
jgi:hypothetical protein